MKRLAYLLFVFVSSLPAPSSDIETWPHGTSLGFNSLQHLEHKGYANVADYDIILLSTKCVTRSQLSDFNPNDVKPSDNFPRLLDVIK